MASVPTLDIEAVLKPISAEKPAGVDIQEAKSFGILKEARRDEEALNQGQMPAITHCFKLTNLHGLVKH